MKIFRIVLSGEEHPHYTISKAFQKYFEHVDTLFWDKEEGDLQRLNSIIQERARKERYDVVFMQIQREKIITLETAKVLSEHSLVFNWTGDVRTDISWYVELSPYLITLFTNMTDVHKLKKEYGAYADYLQVGYDDAYYFKKPSVKYNNISFCGNYYESADFPLKQLRIDAITALKKNFPENFNLYGHDWKKLGLVAEGYADNELEALLYNSTRLSLSISHFDYSRYFSDRLLREMACGSCVLSHRYKDCHIDFIDGEHLVFWDDIDDLIKKTEYYLNHPDEAKKIGDAAAEYVKQNFTWDLFVQRFIQLIDKYKKTKAIKKESEVKNDKLVKLDDVINYIETTELLIPIEDFFDEKGNHITKRKYGEVIIKALVQELKEKFK